MKYLLILLFVFGVTLCYAEINIKVFIEQVGNGYHVYADNNEYCPVSIQLNFKVKNYTIEGGNNRVYVIDALQKRQLLATLSMVKPGKKSNVSMNYLVNYGNHQQAGYDEAYVYDLPYKQGGLYRIDQGYHGKFSHQNENALDFGMPVGTEITAIREGIVVQVVDHHSKSCPKEECMAFNNYIVIYHADGTFAEYTHIKRKGSQVQVGEPIAKGQVIALSGNVGWSSGPHLHLVVFLQGLKVRRSLETKFRTGSGDTTEYLLEKQSYSRNY